MHGAKTTPDARPERFGQPFAEGLGPFEGAGDAVADPDRERQVGARLAVFEDIEVGVERGDLVDLGH